MTENIKAFVYFGSENYTSLSSLRMMVPAVYYFLSFFAAIAGIVGNAPIPAIVFISMVAVYAVIVYSFSLWCPKPSFECRFAANAFSMVSLSIILQSWFLIILWLGRYIDLFDVIIIVVLEIGASLAYFFLTKHRIEKGFFNDKKVSSTNVGFGLISGAGYAGVKLGRMLGDANASLAATVAVAVCVLLGALFSVLATLHLMKYFYCKKYGIKVGQNGETISPLLLSEKKSLPKRIWSFTWKLAILLLMALILYGGYMSTLQPTV